MLNKADLVEQIRAAHRKRVFLIKQRVRVGNALGAFIRTALGWSPNLPEKDRDKIKADAEAIVKKRGEGTEFAWIIAANDAACIKFDEAEAEIEKDLKKLVRQLPVWNSWGKHTRGISEMTIATIVGEAGDLSNYPKKGHLYQRMCIGFVDGDRQGKVASGGDSEEWIRHAYNPERRSRLFGYVGAPIIRMTERVDEKTGKLIEASPYRIAYDQRKAYEVEKVEAAGKKVVPAAKIPKADKENYVSEKHIHLAAQRWMEQRILKHLLQAWKRAD